MRLADRVELLVEACHRVATLEEGKPCRSGIAWIFAELLGELELEPRMRAPDDAAADRLAVDALHHERLAAFHLAEVGDRLRHLDAGFVGGAQHLELVLERQRPLVDDAAGGAADQELAALRVDRPRLLRRPAGEQDGALDRSVERGRERLFHSTSSAITSSASRWRAWITSVEIPASRQGSSRSAIRSFGPTSAISSTSSSGTVIAASPFIPER